MAKRGSAGLMIFISICMLTIIIDTKTAIDGAVTGVEICIRTVIPSLFPFIFLSGIINSNLLGRPIALIRPISQKCKVPCGAESLLLLGFLAGYPVGAQMISQAHYNGCLSKNSANRMLGFCNNAGPAFLFGIVAPLFSKASTIWILWGIHIISAIIVGFLLPANTIENCKLVTTKNTDMNTALQSTIKSMAIICSWIILFRIIITFLNKWLLWMLPVELQVLLSGILELSNGCIMLNRITSEGLRFLIAGAMLAFGGLCIGMQTHSVAKGISFKYYFPGKILQTLISISLSLIIIPIIYRNTAYIVTIYGLLVSIFSVFVCIIFLNRKKVWQLWTNCCIIWKNTYRKETDDAVP